MTRAMVMAALALSGVAGASAGQDKPLKAGMMGSPSIGKRAPAIVLPYVTSAGPGPADQPFRLSAELGRVAVVVFGMGTIDSSATMVVGRLAPLSSRTVVVAGVVHGTPETVLGLATAIGGEFKLLIDQDGRAHRTYGIGRAGGLAAAVIADDGRLIWLGRVEAGSERWWKDLNDTIRRGHTALPKAPK